MMFRNYEGKTGDLEDIATYNNHISGACFWVGASQYQDWVGNWRDIGDTNPVVIYPDPEILDGEVVDEQNP
jgi:hypothetical protein